MRASKSSDKPALRKQGLRSVSELLPDLPGPVQALIPSRLTQHHFTLAETSWFT